MPELAVRDPETHADLVMIDIPEDTLHALQRIDSIAATVQVFETNAANRLVHQIKLAQAIQMMRSALNDNLMETAIMPLANTSFGFGTDRDPRTPGGRDAVKKHGPYTINAIREVAIEALLGGFRLVGGEIDVISGRCYPKRPGFMRQLLEHPSFSDYNEERIEITKVNRDGAFGDTATVECHATWRWNGTPQELSRKFIVRLNRGQTADAVDGKAKRKLAKAVFERCLGLGEDSLPDGDASEAMDVASRVLAEEEAETTRGQLEVGDLEPTTDAEDAPETITRKQQRDLVAHARAHGIAKAGEVWAIAEAVAAEHNVEIKRWSDVPVAWLERIKAIIDAEGSN